MQNTWIHNSKAKEELLIKHTDIHWVYKYNDLDTDWLRESWIYESIDTINWNKFYAQEARDSMESINRFDLFIPDWVNLNDYNWSIVVWRRKNTWLHEDIFDLFLTSDKAIDFIRSFWKENMSEYLKNNLNAEAEKLESIDQDRFGELQISLIVQDRFGNYTSKSKFNKRITCYDYIQKKIATKIKWRDEYTFSDDQAKWYNSLHIFLYRKLPDFLQTLEKEYKVHVWRVLLYEDFARDSNNPQADYDSPFIKFSISKITEAISDYFNTKKTT